MDIDRVCSVCPEEAPMFCRMCNLHYCPDHLCLHLNVAWENNTWTSRNNNDSEGSGTRSEVCHVQSDNSSRDTIPHAPKSILSYTEAELQSQYNFYLSQARRIRVELERRCLPLAGTPQSTQKRTIPRSCAQYNKPKHRPAVPKSATHAVELLLSRMRAGTLSATDIQQGIAVAQMRAARKNS